MNWTREFSKNCFNLNKKACNGTVVVGKQNNNKVIYNRQTVCDISLTYTPPKKILVTSVFKIKKLKRSSPILPDTATNFTEYPEFMMQKLNRHNLAGLQDKQTQFVDVVVVVELRSCDWHKKKKDYSFTNGSKQKVFPKQNITKVQFNNSPFFFVFSSKVHNVWNKEDRWGGRVRAGEVGARIQGGQSFIHCGGGGHCSL